MGLIDLFPFVEAVEDAFNKDDPGLPPAASLPSASEEFGKSLDIFEQRFPGAFGARETALGQLTNIGPEFFQRFQPTSFEEALATQQFQNIFPDVERSIKQNLSLSGIASSPILAEQIARARGQIGVDIGSQLAQLGQQRAGQSLQGLSQAASISPISETQNLFNQTLSQGNLQAQLNAQRAQQVFQQQQAQGSGLASTIGTLAGGGLGFALGGPAGAGIGASLGGTAGSLFGGGQAPVSFQDALAFSQAFPGQQGPTNLGPGVTSQGIPVPSRTAFSVDPGILPRNLGQQQFPSGFLT